MILIDSIGDLKMSTRSYIAVKENNVFKFVYCHYDGYVSGVGLELLKNYNSYEKALELVNLGNRSTLSENPNDGLYENESFHTAENLNEILETLGGIEYIYVYENGWLVYTSHPIIEEFFSYETRNRIFSELPYEFEKKTLSKSLFGESNKTPQTINKLLAYELVECIERLEKDERYADVVNGNKEILNECLKNGIITNSELKANEYDRRVFKELAKEEIEKLTKLAETERERIAIAEQNKLELIKSRTVFHDMKETAKLVKKALTKNKIKSSVRSSYWYGVNIEVAEEDLEKAKEIINPFVESNKKYENSFEAETLEESYEHYTFDNYSSNRPNFN